MNQTEIIGYGWKSYEVLNGSPCHPSPLQLFTEANPLVLRRRTIRHVLDLIAEDERRWEKDRKSHVNHMFDVFIMFMKDGAASTFPVFTYQYNRLIYGLMIEGAIYKELSSNNPIPTKPLLDV